jgi:hypothetical protein
MTYRIMPSDVAFTMFLDTVRERDLSEYEYRLWQAAMRSGLPMEGNTK